MRNRDLYDKLKNSGNHKIYATKLVRGICSTEVGPNNPHVGLREAKDFVDGFIAPANLQHFIQDQLDREMTADRLREYDVFIKEFWPQGVRVISPAIATIFSATVTIGDRTYTISGANRDEFRAWVNLF